MSNWRFHGAERLAVANDRGFTLIETLVTMALTAMIAGVLWQAMQRITRIERMLQGSGVNGQLNLVRREWLRDLIQAALVEQIGVPRRFIGDARHLSLASSETLAMPGLGGGPLHIHFETDAATRRHRLMVEVKSSAAMASSEKSETLELLAWAGKEGRLRYLGADGVWIDQWPNPNPNFVPTGDPDADFRLEAQAALPRLPRAVWLDMGQELGGSLVVQVSTTQAGRGRLAQWEQQ